MFHPSKSILPHLKIANIAQARQLGVVIQTIKCRTEASEKLITNINLWIAKENVLLDTVTTSKSYTYGGSSYNGRTLTGRQYLKVKYFSNFKILTETDDGYLEGLSFESLSDAELDKYKDYPNYDPSNSPSLLQVAYGLIKKHEGVIQEVYGHIPKVFL